MGIAESQDIFQRVVASRSEKVAVYSSIFSGALYLVIGIVPLIIVLMGQLVYPDLYAVNKENFITTLITVTTPQWVQVIFFGALISAILSTASGALLAPSTVFAENILKPLNVGKDLLLNMRISVVIMALVSVILAFNNQSVFELVSIASSFGLVSLFIPYEYKASFSPIYKKAIKGYYLNFDTFKNFDNTEKKYYIPSKKEWGMDPSENNSWTNFDSVKKQITTSVKEKQSPLCWQKYKNSYLTFFIIWW